VTPIKNNLVALGSAAVVAVYAAGYMRTKAAADRFAVEDAARRQDHERRVQPTAVAPVPTSPAPAKDTSRPPVPVDHESAPKHVARKASRSVAQHVAPDHADSARAAAPEVVSKPVESPPPVSAPAAPVAAAPLPGTTFKVTPPPSADTAQAEDKPLKDGVYSGWGTSRHGDIQATVAIKNGKITEAFISECLTQYSCSWVAALPPQVVARQSAEVDYVSGATQSTNAFYYAVIAALKKAK
jgi:uncharacterized protein with FMN-binding domain